VIPTYIQIAFMACLVFTIGFGIYRYLPSVNRNTWMGVWIRWIKQSDENWLRGNQMIGMSLMVGAVVLVPAAGLVAYLTPIVYRSYAVSAVVMLDVVGALLVAISRCHD
jgi:hypothetical protein